MHYNNCLRRILLIFKLYKYTYDNAVLSYGIFFFFVRSAQECHSFYAVIVDDVTRSCTDYAHFSFYLSELRLVGTIMVTGVIIVLSEDFPQYYSLVSECSTRQSDDVIY